MGRAFDYDSLLGVCPFSHEHLGLRRDVLVLVAIDEIRRNGFPGGFARGLISAATVTSDLPARRMEICLQSPELQTDTNAVRAFQ